MEGQSDQENPLQKMFFTSGGTISHASGSAVEDDDQSMQQDVVAERSGSQWTCLPKQSQNYVQYLTESSTYLPKTEVDMIGSNYAPIDETNKNLFYNDPGNGCGLKTSDHSSTEVDIGKQVGFWRINESEVHQEAMQFESTQHHLVYNESPASWTPESIGDKHDASRLDQMVMSGAPCFLPKPGSCSSTKQKTADRLRRHRIADNLKALHDLLPNRPEGSQAYILDDIIDHVKYLQLHLKELSVSRLQAESTDVPLVFHEGYGHYIDDQQTLNEPLEEMMGKLLEEHPGAATQLLESKGLVVLPMDLVEDLSLAVQMFGGGGSAFV